MGSDAGLGDEASWDLKALFGSSRGHRNKFADYGASFEAGDVVTCCVDRQRREISFGINGMWWLGFKKDGEEATGIDSFAKVDIWIDAKHMLNGFEIISNLEVCNM